MVTFLLFLSFLLNIVSLLSIVILYVRQNRFVNIEKEQKKMIAEMEDVISTYLIEMKEENNEFIRSFKSQAHTEKRGNEPSEEKREDVPPLTQENPQWTGTGYKRATQAYQKGKKLQLESTDHTDGPGENTERDPLIQQVILMKENGMTIEEIAKSVGKGQTEIELLLKFRQIM